MEIYLRVKKLFTGTKLFTGEKSLVILRVRSLAKIERSAEVTFRNHNKNYNCVIKNFENKVIYG